MLSAVGGPVSRNECVLVILEGPVRATVRLLLKKMAALLFPSTVPLLLP